MNITEFSDVRILECNIHDNEAFGVNVDTESVLVLRDTNIHNNTPGDGLDVVSTSTVDVVETPMQNNGSPGLNGGIGVFIARNSLVRFHKNNVVQNNGDIRQDYFGLP